MLDVKMADFARLLHPGVLIVGPKEEHLMMVLFSSYRRYPKLRVNPKYRVIPDVSGYPLPDNFQN